MKKTTTYRQSKQESLFEKEFTLKALSAMDNPLEQVSALVDFEFFRLTLEKTLLTEDCKTSTGRRPMGCRSYVQSHISPTLLWSGRPPDRISDY